VSGNPSYSGGFACLVAAWSAFACVAGAEDRYELWRRDGRRLTGQRFERLFDTKRRPSLDGKELDRPQRYLRAIHNTSLRSRLSGPHVELVNGDVLGGVVYAGVLGDPQGNKAPRIMIASGAASDRHPRRGEVGGLAVHWPSVRRVVLVPGPSQPVAPGHVRLRDGRRLAAQAVRLSQTGITALTDDGVRRIPFDRLGEVHLPRRGAAEAVVADGVWWRGDPDNPVVRVLTTDGARLTFAFSMARAYGGTVLVRPRWAGRAIHLDMRSAVWITFRRGDEVPLSLLEARTLKTRTLLHHWPWRRNRSVRGTDLRCGPIAAELGVGTHSYCQVAFDLPAGARTFTTWVGLDRSAGLGGCASCSVYRDAVAGRPLWQGRFMRGSRAPVRVGEVSIAGAKRLVLVTDFGHEGRPAGADPLDIRDFVNWVMPVVKVDPASVPRPIDDLAHWIPALGGWSIPPEQMKTLKINTDVLEKRKWDLALDIHPNKGLMLTRKITPSLAACILDVSAARGHKDGGHVIALLVDGEQQSGVRIRRTVRQKYYRPKRGQSSLYTRQVSSGGYSWDGMRWDLGRYRGKEVTLSLRVTKDPKADSGRGLVFRDISFLPIVHGLGAGGRILVPDVPLAKASPIEVVSHRDRQNPGEAPAPKPAAHTVHGVELPNSYTVRNGLNMTYKLDASYRRFVAVVGSGNSYHRGPFQVYLDEKLVWQSGACIDAKRLEQVIVDIPPSTSTIGLKVKHDMTSGVWGQAGFMTH